MPKFQFRLQQFLGIKEQIEDMKELAYGKALMALEVEKAHLARLTKTLADAINTQRIALHTHIVLTDVVRLYSNIDRLNHNIEAQIQRVQAAEAFAEARRLELVEAMKERKALEIIREKSFEDYTREADLTERKQVDELISYKHTSK